MVGTALLPRLLDMSVPAPSDSLQARIVSAASELTAESGWSAITMAKLAGRVGVSRQTVYNEIGTKNALAEAMILAELERFLTVVDTAFDAHPGDLVGAIEGAARAVLEMAQDNQLLHAVVSATHGADTELLPLLTTHSAVLLGSAKAVVRERVDGYDVDLHERHLDAAIDMVVRVVLSHIMQPSSTAADTAADIAWITRRVLG